VIEAQNVIVHGLGEPTRRQTDEDRGAAVRKQLA
jgi:hypothetical protein